MSSYSRDLAEDLESLQPGEVGHGLIEGLTITVATVLLIPSALLIVAFTLYFLISQPWALVAPMLVAPIAWLWLE